MKRIRTGRPRIRRERPWAEDLPADPRDPDVVRAKVLARARLKQPACKAALGDRCWLPLDDSNPLSALVPVSGQPTGRRRPPPLCAVP
jgi:hypothetical protein